MGSKKFIRCCVCDAIHHVSPFDKAPAYKLVGIELEEQATDDWRLFMEQHTGHRLEPLKASGEQFFPRGAPMDPMSVAYIEVTNGRESYLLRRARKSIQESMIYELVQGRLTDAGLTVEIQENEIKKEMKNHFSWAPASCPDEPKIALFVSLFKEVVKMLDPYRIQVSQDSHTDGSFSYGTLGSAALDILVDRCAVCFSPDELTSIRRFVETHRNDCGVMALVLRRQVNIEQSTS
jgi:hypothetical protein